jgi:muconolactone delta-isomerase
MRFMVESTFNQVPTDDILALIPAEIAHGKELDARGVRDRLYIAADQSGAWQVFEVESREALQDILTGFPLYPFLAFKVTELAPDNL